MRRFKEGARIVSPGRYLTHHKNVAKEIEIILLQFGSSGDTPGFWCKPHPHGNLLDCISECEFGEICQHTPPPLYKEYEPEGNNPWRGDMALRFIMTDRELGNQDDWVWLQHPGTRSRISQQIRKNNP